MFRARSTVPIFGLIAVWAAGCSDASNPGADPSAPATPITLISPVSVRPPGTVEERVKLAEELAAKGELREAIAKLEEAILIDDRDRAVRLHLVKYLLADSQDDPPAGSESKALHEHGQVVRARGYLEGLQKYYPEQTEEEKQLSLKVLYELARLEAREKPDDEALIALREAVEAGFRDFDKIRSDPDWKKYLAHPAHKKDFEKIVEDARSR